MVVKDVLLDVAEDAVIAVVRSPGRSALLGLGALVAATLFSFSAVQGSTEATRVARSFDELAATRVQIALPVPGSPYEQLTARQVDVLRDQPGVVAVAWGHREDMLATSVRQPIWQVDTEVTVWTLGGDVEAFALDVEHGAQALPDAVWAGGALLDGRRLPVGALLELDGRPSTVGGTIRRSPVAPQLSSAVVRASPSPDLGLREEGLIVLQVRPGWAELSSRAVAQLLLPDKPDQVYAQYAPEATGLRTDVVARVDALVAVVAVALLLVSAVAVGVTTFARVLERRRLIGLFRAMGATRTSIAAALVLEAMLTTGAAVVAGCVIGGLAATAAAGLSDVVVPWPVLGLGAAAALVLNALGAVVPAVAVTRKPPVEAIRG